jgi:hypothetical protein
MQAARGGPPQAFVGGKPVEMVTGQLPGDIELPDE